MSQQTPTSTYNDFDEEALDWLVRRNDGFNNAEESQFQQWLAADVRHQQAFEHWQADWSAFDQVSEQDIIDLKQQLASDIAAEARPASVQQHVTPKHWWQWLAVPAWRPVVGASLLTICITSIVVWYQLHHYAFDHTYTTLQGQAANVTLPDDSELWLDTATQATVSLRRHHREVIMPHGQMVFYVKGDVARPFDVITGNTRITVVGTRFSVRYTPDIASNHQVQVAVEEGRVRVAPANAPDQAVELTAGQSVAVNDNGKPGPIVNDTDTEIGLWRHQRVSFDNIPLSDALAEFDRYAPARLVITEPQVAAMRITGTFDPTNLDNFTRTLPRVLPVTIRQQHGQSVIVRR